MGSLMEEMDMIYQLAQMKRTYYFKDGSVREIITERRGGGGRGLNKRWEEGLNSSDISVSEHEKNLLL